MSPRPGGLGRGLGALIPAAAPARTSTDQETPGTSSGPAVSDAVGPPPAGSTFQEIPRDAIRPNPKQPRAVFDEDALAELVVSLREVGMLQPVVVRPLPQPDGEHRYELVMGERRWRASGEAGWTHVPAIIRHTDDADMLRDALLENLHRSQLNPLEEAAAYAQLLEEFQVTHDQLAQQIGRSRSQVSNTIRLLGLPPQVQRRVAAGVLSAGHARALLALPDHAAQEDLAGRIVAEGLSVRAVEELVALGRDAADRPTRGGRPRAARAADPRTEELAARVAELLDTRVTAEVNARGRGRLVVEVADLDDLARVADLIVGRGRDGADARPGQALEAPRP